MTSSETGSAELLWDVLAANDSMHAVARCVQLIEARLDYPIGSREDLVRVVRHNASADGHLRIDRCRISADRVRRGLPARWFPVGSRQALISVLLAAFEGDRLRHIGLVTGTGAARRQRGRSHGTAE